MEKSVRETRTDRLLSSPEFPSAIHTIRGGIIEEKRRPRSRAFRERDRSAAAAAAGMHARIIGERGTRAPRPRHRQKIEREIHALVHACKRERAAAVHYFRYIGDARLLVAHTARVSSAICSVWWSEIKLRENKYLLPRVLWIIHCGFWLLGWPRADAYPSEQQRLAYNTVTRDEDESAVRYLYLTHPVSIT